ncbi:MAG TPA: hypothetical protein VMR21_01225 [Vicinamibacteria bacterium]|nr:hypothetical protein [Vicinamibacteria bacterium]
MMITDASRLSDPELVNALTGLAGAERQSTAALIVHLAEFDARRLCEAAGFSSTFSYCVKVLHLSEDAAVNRIKAARAARRFPLVLDLLLSGALSPTTARMVARHLTPANHEELLAAAAGRTRQEVEALLARIFPRPDVRPSMRPLAARRGRDEPSLRPVMLPAAPGTLPTASGTLPIASNTQPTASGAPPSAAPEGTGSAAVPNGLAGCLPPTPPPSPGAPSTDGLSLHTLVEAVTTPPAERRPVARPLAADRYEIRFTVNAETYANLRLAQDLLGHAVPSGDLALVFDRALSALVTDLKRRKFGATEKPRESRREADDSPYIPAAVRRAVYKRDGGRCAFVGSGGRRCGERRFVQFHHVVPRGVGGKATVDNVQLRCGVHNRHEAELFYGPGRRYGGGADVVRETHARPGTGLGTRPRTGACATDGITRARTGASGSDGATRAGTGG